MSQKLVKKQAELFLAVTNLLEVQRKELFAAVSGPPPGAPLTGKLRESFSEYIYPSSGNLKAWVYPIVKNMAAYLR